MLTATEVMANISARKALGIPLSEAAWETALDCVGWPYVFAAWGEECTPANRRRRYNADHPTIKTSCKNFGGSGTCEGCKWFPKGERVRMFDCRGFTDWILKQFGIDLQGEGATSQWNNKDNWDLKGEIRDVPDDVLVCLFVHNSSTGKKEHTGFGYKGQTCECSSGVQHFDKRKAKWTHFAIPKGLGGDIKPTIRKGDKGSYVQLAQTLLMQKGYDLGKWGADGSFGQATEAAVKAFQGDYGLQPDGVVGPKTWEALTGQTVSRLYTVQIPHLTKYKAEALVQQYSGSFMTEEKG